ncbi:MAG: DUF1376 domain-containing protein [Rudaea sp.]|nr:DUF1376 domain-containing protein [Rudaea sp.]
MVIDSSLRGSYPTTKLIKQIFGNGDSCPENSEPIAVGEMHYYKRNIGDYAKKAGHLSALEHGVYNLILDAYYDAEKPPTRHEALRQARARTKQEIVAVEVVLSEFFDDVGDTYVQKRVEEEIAKYRERAAANQIVAVEREKARKERSVNDSATNKERPARTRSPNQEPTTRNQEPKTRQMEGAVLPACTNLPQTERGQTFSSWVKSLTDEEDCIPTDDPVFAYADRVGLPREMLRLAFRIFENRYENADKRYKSWRAVFRKAVGENWFRLWYVDSQGNYQLTTAGIQAHRAEFGQ